MHCLNVERYSDAMNLRLPALSAAALLACACATPRVTTTVPTSAVEIQPGLRATPVDANAWVITHEAVYESNVLVVRFPDGTVVICSSPFDTRTTRALVAWVRETLRPQRMVAINTHWHMDGSGGNEAWKEAGVTIYATRQTQALLRERGARSRETSADGLAAELAESVRATPVVDADQLFDEAEGLSLSFGGERAEVKFPGAAHSQDNLVVYFPAHQLLFGGCALKVGNSLGYLGDASLATWESALEVMRRYPARIVVPGHGTVGGPEIIENTSRLLREAKR